ncbi:peptidoglycan-binding domain-containing protein [Calothrix sp. 336/3]|uniref:peptidoglycan-binding domain-containing protein n=1 Tax=Calothrix sp. 336/3 TaxID=1337936 RepID=UPI00069C13C2|nr:peptidoglycan-binding protein [Calothrix sp. 336/3]
MTTFTNAQFRSIMYGLGYVGKQFADPALGYPVSNDNTPLIEEAMIQGIVRFQQDYQLKADGVVGAKTMAKAAEVMRILQHGLNIVIKAGLPQGQPFYGPKTLAAVKKFQSYLGVSQSGIATKALRRQLDELAKEKV